VVVDEHAAVDGQAGLLRELDVGPDAGGHHDDVGLENAVVRERHALDVAVAEDGGRGAPEHHLDAKVLHLAEQVLAAVGIQLPLHQRGHQVHDRDLAPLHLQPARGLEAEQAAADHDRLGALARALDERPRVVEGAEREDAVLVEPLDRRHEGAAPGRQQEHVVGRDAAVVAGDGLGAASTSVIPDADGAGRSCASDTSRAR
jgi:hypothetical protein